MIPHANAMNWRCRGVLVSFRFLVRGWCCSPRLEALFHHSAINTWCVGLSAWPRLALAFLVFLLLSLHPLRSSLSCLSIVRTAQETSMASYLLSLSPFKVFATEAGDSASASASTSTSTSTSSTSTGLPPLTSSPRPATPRSRSGRRSMKRDRPSPVPASFFGDGPQSSVATSSSPIRASKRKGKGRMLTEEQEEEAGGSGRLSSDAHSDEGVELLPDDEDGVVRLGEQRRGRLR